MTRGHFTPKAMAYNWITGDIYVVGQVSRKLRVLSLSEERGMGYRTISDGVRVADKSLVQLTTNPFNGCVMTS